MLTYLARRLVLAVITIFAITVVTFVILHLPPVDFVTAYAAQAAASGSAISRRRGGCDAPRLRTEPAAVGAILEVAVRWWRAATSAAPSNTAGR